MLPSRKAVAATLATASSAVLILTGSLPAFAHDGIFVVRTSDKDPGGEAHLYHAPDDFVEVRACDIQKDGYGVVAEAHFGPGGSSIATVVARDMNGANNGVNGCGKPRGVFPGSGQEVTVKVCLVDRDGKPAGKRQKGRCRFVEREGVVA